MAPNRKTAHGPLDGPAAAVLNAVISIGSPSGVPVPCTATIPKVLGDMPALHVQGSGFGNFLKVGDVGRSSSITGN